MLLDAKVCGEILLQLLNNVLDTAKLAGGQLEVSISTFSLREFLERMWSVTSEIIRKKGLYGVLALDINAPDNIDFDSHRMMQTMINLVSNAVKFTDKGFVKIYIEFVPGEELEDSQILPKYFSTQGLENRNSTLALPTEYENHWDLDEYKGFSEELLTFKVKKFGKTESLIIKQHKRLPSINELPSPKNANSVSSVLQNSSISQEETGYIRVEIVDSGCGMTSTQVESIFTKFNQVSNESTKRQVGTGLGLWITKELVNLMDGQIRAYSAPGFGSSFVFTLKSHSHPNRPVEKISPSNSAVASDDAEPMRCLVVEDSLYNQEVHRKLLECCRLKQIFTVSDGLEALELIKARGEGYFGLILMDLDMPIMEGRLACKCIRELEQARSWKPLKIAILTGYSEAKTKQELLNKEGPCKADYFLSKPASIGVLSKVVREVFPNSSNKGIRSIDKELLIVDDDMFNLVMMEKICKKLGLKCKTACNGEEAVAKYSQEGANIGLILMDCEMPLMNGYEATRRILDLAKKFDANKAPSIIGVTGHSKASHESKALDSGMSELMTKPVTVLQLEDLIKRKML